jgi:acetylornithine deacetylase/succinyl-diaminopimelate desuccinylase-like protein
MTDRDAPVVRAVGGDRGVLGREPDYVVSPGTYDQKHIDRIGRLKNCIAYGPGILDLAHQPDEWVGIDDMVDSAKVMAASEAPPAARNRFRIRNAFFRGFFRQNRPICRKKC